MFVELTRLTGLRCSVTSTWPMALVSSVQPLLTSLVLT